MKRSDLPTRVVLAAVRDHGFNACTQLQDVAGYPYKIVLAAFERDVSRGLLDYGTAIVSPWLTPAGARRLVVLELGGPHA